MKASKNQRSPLGKRRSEQRLALFVAGVFLLAGILWVLVTDLLLYTFAHDPVVIARLETAKGWAFVLLATGLLYCVTLLAARRLARARALMSAVVESIGDGLLLLGPDRTVVHANPAAKKMLGCDELIGMDAEEFSRRFRVSYPSGALVPPQRYVSQRVFDEGGPLHYKALLHPVGRPELIVSVTAAAVREQVGAPADMAVSVMHDITVAERLESLRDQFLAAAAHALKTPVTIIKVNVQALLSTGGRRRLEHSSAVIERQCARIDQIVQNLLVLARIRSGTLKLQQQVVALAPLVEQMTRQAAATSLRNDVRCDLAASPHVYGDRERLALAIRDLIEQAIQSSLPGAPVRVVLRIDERAARVGVRYQPLLIPEERAGTSHAEYDELGISRLVTKTIAEAHGGSVREEESGTNAVSWLRLPTVEAA